MRRKISRAPADRLRSLLGLLGVLLTAAPAWPGDVSDRHDPPERAFSFLILDEPIPEVPDRWPHSADLDSRFAGDATVVKSIAVAARTDPAVSVLRTRRAGSTVPRVRAGIRDRSDVGVRNALGDLRRVARTPEPSPFPGPERPKNDEAPFRHWDFVILSSLVI